jgi:hypothetical protein
LVFRFSAELTIHLPRYAFLRRCRSFQDLDLEQLAYDGRHAQASPADYAFGTPHHNKDERQRIEIVLVQGDALKERLRVIQELEAARCFEESVIEEAAEADVGAVLGWGFAPWTGVPPSYIAITFAEVSSGGPGSW